MCPGRWKSSGSCQDHPQLLTPEALLAQSYERAGDRENAKKWMIAALTLAPKDPKTRLVAAHWGFTGRTLERAQTQAAAALQLDPTSFTAKILRGVVAIFQKDYPTAERYFVGPLAVTEELCR